jgi:hypothetical protein
VLRGRNVAAMAANVSLLIFSGLAITLLGALALPAPAFKVSGETAILVALLVAASIATVLTGAVALIDMPAASAACGVIAWLLVVQCVWLARTPKGQEEWDAEEEEDDGGGGSPGPSTPPETPSPGDGLPVLQQPGGAPALPAWAPAPAHSFPLAAAPSTAQVTAAPCAAAAKPPETAHRRRLQRTPAPPCEPAPAAPARLPAPALARAAGVHARAPVVRRARARRPPPPRAAARAAGPRGRVAVRRPVGAVTCDGSCAIRAPVALPRSPLGSPRSFVVAGRGERVPARVSRCSVSVSVLVRSLPRRRSARHAGSRHPEVRFSAPSVRAIPCGRSRGRCSPGGPGG